MTVPSTAGSSVDRETAHEIEQLLYLEAALLDSWDLDGWLALLTDDCSYLIPATDRPNAVSPETEAFIIADKHPQIVARVRRLQSGSAFVETPHSSTRRLVTNVRANALAAGGFEVSSNFSVYRSRRGVAHVFVGSYRHLLIRDGGGALLIKERRAVLACDELRPQGKISFIL
jgi:p-cumate 2,3-dioxygenase beta subunit